MSTSDALEFCLEEVQIDVYIGQRVQIEHSNILAKDEFLQMKDIHIFPHFRKIRDTRTDKHSAM